MNDCTPARRDETWRDWLDLIAWMGEEALERKHNQGSNWIFIY